uniref:Cathepsin L1-like n=1 Tax=Sciurus vulgaris TaxID=55149 RepID=A0A8D2B0S5_SCIVU
MNPFLFLVFLCMRTVSAALALDHSLHAQWHEWKAKHGKTYSKVEGWRRAVWEKNLRMIEQHNGEYSQGKHGFTMAMNAFGDMTNEEFGQVRNSFQYQKLREGQLFQEPLFGDVPDSVDWREEGYVTPVKDQGHCGSCWAFSATGALEGQMFRKTGVLVSLSEQNLLDCSRVQGNQGCHGGLMDSAFQYIKDNGGLDSEESYPYEAQVTELLMLSTSHICLGKSGTVSEYRQLCQNSHVKGQSLRTLYFHTSVLASVECIYYDAECKSHEPNHAVLVVGYGFEGTDPESNKYWLVKNSWSTGWGIDGYMKMARDQNNLCGIASAACYPTVS